MKKQLKQDMDILDSVNVVGRKKREGFGSRFVRAASILLLGWIAPATAMAAVDLQITDFSDTGYDPIPAGSTISYAVTVDNGGNDPSGPVAVLFDLPSGFILSADAPPYCTAVSTLTGSRVTCLLPAPLQPNGGSEYSFALPVTTLTAVDDSHSARASVGNANALPDANTPLQSLPGNDPFFGGEANTSNNTLEQTTTLTEATNLSLEKTASVNQVTGGGEITYTMAVTNAGPTVATKFVVEDVLPSTLSYVAGSAAGAGWSFSGPNGTYTGQLAVGATATYTFRAKVNAESGTVVNPAEVKTGAGEPIDPVTDDNKSTVATTVSPGADLSLEKRPDPAIVAAGELVTFTLFIRNNGPSTATNVTVVDPMPAGFLIESVDAFPAGWSCAPNPANTQLNCSVSSLASGGPVEIKVTARVPVNGVNSSGTVSNTATVGSDVDDPVSSNNSGTTSIDVLPDGADLAMAKNKSPALVPVWVSGQSKTDSMMTSEMTVTNKGPRAVEGDVQIVDTLAVGEQLVDAVGDPITAGVPFDPDGSGAWRCVATPYLTGTQQKVTCDQLTGYSIPNGGSSPKLTLHTLAREAGALQNEACTGGSGGSKEPTTAGGINLDPTTTNDCAGGNSRATQQYAELSIEKLTNGPGDADNELAVGDSTVNFTLKVTNSTTSGATGGIIVADPIPGYIAGVTSVTSTPVTGWTCGMESNNFTCRSNAGTKLQPGASVEFNVAVTRGLVDSNGVAGNPRCGNVANRHCNVAEVRIDKTHPDALGELSNSGQFAADWFSVAPVTNVSTRKAITAGNPGRVGTESAYQITYINDKTSPAPGVIFRDTFTLKANDAGFVLVSASRTGGGVTACTVEKPLQLGVQEVLSAVSGQYSYSNTSGSEAKLVISCTPIDMGRQATQTMSVRIRPNIDAGNTTGRTLFNEADFTFTGPSSGPDFNYNSNTADDKSTAILSFDQGTVDLITNKEDRGFTGAVDPLGFDSSAGGSANNRVFYRVSVTNNGPSLATNVHIDDTITPPARATGTQVGLAFIGSMTGPVTGPTGPLVAPGSGGLCYGTGSNGTSTATGEPISIRCKMPATGAGIVEDGVIASRSTSHLFLVYEYLTAPPGAGETLSNSATASSNENDTNPNNNTGSQTTSIRSRVDLTIVKTAHELLPQGIPSTTLPADAGPLGLRQKFWYVMEVENKGPGHALNALIDGEVIPGALVKDTLPAGLEVIGGAAAITWQKTGTAIADEPGAVTTDGGSCALDAGNAISCNLGDMSVGGRARILVPVRWTSYPPGDTAINTGVVTTSQVESNPNNNTDDVTVTLLRSSLAGTVFHDQDRTGGNGGIQNGADAGISGFKLTLTGRDLYGDDITTYLTEQQRTVTTDSNGRFKFSDLAPADAAGYTLVQTQDAKYVNGDIDPPTTGTGAPSHGGTYAQVDPANVKTSNTRYSGIALAMGVDAVDYNFPEIRRPTLSGHVYVDLDENDVFTTGANGDPAIDKATVILQSSTGAPIASVETDASGRYQFTDLDPLIEYVLVQPLPTPNYVNRPSAVKAGTIGTVACAAGFCAVENRSGDIDAITKIDMSAGLDGVDFDFGEQALSDISGYVYVDRDADGKFDPTKDNDVNNTGTSRPNGGLEGIEIVLTPYDRLGVAQAQVTVFTNSDGYYEFLDRQAGLRYTLHQKQQPVGYADAAENPITAPINIPSLKVNGATDNNFGEKLASLAGFVYEDFSANAATNNNGAKDAGENLIAGVTLALSGTDVNNNSVTRTTTSDAATGAYSFGDLLQGTYIITETQPAGYEDGKHTAGNAATPGNTSVANIISGIGLNAGQDALGYLFGELKKSQIEGTVYLDLDDNGNQNGAEPGIAGVTITLEVETTTGTWEPVVTAQPIITDADGHYSYADGVIGKSYRITQTQPTGLADGKENTSNVITITNLPVAGSKDNDFGEIAAVLSGVVYLDRNDNGVQDSGEPGLPNVEVELPAGTVDALGNTVAKAVTNASGEYEFVHLLAGTYTVTEQSQQPSFGGAVTSNGKTTAGSVGGTATDVATVPSAISGIVLAAGGKSESNNFGEILVAGISGTVYVDRNDNGSFDAGDAGSVNSAANGGIENVVVVLYAADGTTELARTQTDAQGNYAFADLLSDVGYVVKELQPAGYAEGKEHTTNEISISTLPVNGSAGNNFGETLASLDGVVFEDFSGSPATNNNGVFDSAVEKAIAGVTLTLTGTDANNATVSRTTTTDANGAYSFGDLLKGTYTVTETQPASYIDGKHTAGNATTPGSNAVTNVISAIGLDAGQKATGYLFGELANAPIIGTVYLDRNDNGSQDGTDPGIPGVSIVITSNGPDGLPGTADDVNEKLTTDANGNYSYPDAIAGVDYTITQTQPTGLADGKENTSNVITINNLPVTGSTGNNFGEIAAVLSGVVYLDRNNNGVQDSGEPGLPNVEVELPAGTQNAVGQVVAKAVTDADGKYQFVDLVAGTYKVTQQATQPSWNGTSTTNGITTAGTTGGAATAVNVVPSAISGITLAAGGKSESNNFGEVLQVSVAGTVFLDVNNDGAIAGADEIGLDGVVIELNGVDDTGATVSLTTTTDKDGKFSFEGLRPGKYSLTEPTQPTGTANGITTAGTVGGTASGTATPVTTVPSKITDIDLSTPGTASVDNLFGEIPRSSGISGKVWVDTDNDGVVDPDEKGIAGVTVELEGTAIDGTPIKATVTTDADGNYSFTDLPPGTYTVTEPTQPPGTLDGKTVPGTTGGTATTPGTTPSKISTITVGVNETSSDNNFGEIPVGSIAGFVYNDSNDDGIKQSDEGGYALVDIVLTGTDDLGNPVSMSGKTDVQGHYLFENLRPGTYVVTEPMQPAETLNGLTTAGSIDGVRSNAKVTGKETTPSEINGIVLKPGNNSLDNNFGEIGDSPDMLVSKSSTTVKFTVNNVATYTIRVRNGGQKPSSGEYIVKDRLPVGLNLAEVPSGNGWICTGAVGDARFECRSSEVLNASTTSTSDITVKVNVTAEAAQAGTVNNAVLVEGGGENEFRTPTTTERNTFEGDVTQLPVCDTAITQNVCRVPNQVQLSASVGGTVWFDIGSDDSRLDGGDERLQSWIVELLDAATGIVSKTTTTAMDGTYRFGDVVPGIKWNIQFRDPASGVLWAWPVNQETAGGMGVACDSPRAITDSSVSACRVTENGTSQLQVVLESGQHLPQQSLPVDPSGVVYDAVTRDPVPGSIVTITPVGVCNGYDPMTAILNAAAGGYRVEGNAVSMTVGNNGYYQFMFGPAAPARCEFQLTVTPPGGYQFVSSLITPQDGSLSPLGAAGSSHLVQPQSNAPTGAVGTPTQYWLTLFAGSSTAGIVHNHIPLDTAEATGLVITKTGDRQTAEIGDTVQYTITVRQTAGSAMATLNIVDTLPRGFTFIDGTARIGGRALDNPLGKPGPRLGFNLGPINVGQQLVLTYRVRVGVGAQQGDGINRAQAHGCSITGGCIDPGSMTPVPGSVPSNRAEYRVRVTGGVFTEEACVLGKVFVDCNNNHLQDNEELGIPGVRLYFSNGTWVISDSEGKYSYCGLTPQSHTLKVDASTLPAGSRLTTSSNRNLGDADSLFLDLKNGELHRADFIEGSCSNPLLEQVKARRTQGEVRAPETETGQSQLRFESKPARAPQQATDSANQRPIVHPRPNPPSAAASQEVQP
ncbi:SdrD B-like domain-containing protein [Stenotrophomonas sp. Iso1]|uniref:SdrD B-like domain-containing protein n=1 Tax=Stenotrophomonas sp. Iso1 TaxID=2977283 RepID=UPI0022B7CAE3|nr:SdrD B-like domain-containing protein [Stenotrophomonas sp. Iso1]